MTPPKTFKGHASRNPATVLFVVGYATFVVLVAAFGVPWP